MLRSTVHDLPRGLFGRKVPEEGDLAFSVRQARLESKLPIDIKRGDSLRVPEWTDDRIGGIYFYDGKHVHELDGVEDDNAYGYGVIPASLPVTDFGSALYFYDASGFTNFVHADFSKAKFDAGPPTRVSVQPDEWWRDQDHVWVHHCTLPGDQKWSIVTILPLTVEDIRAATIFSRTHCDNGISILDPERTLILYPK